jgi:hypothetical protein
MRRLAALLAGIVALGVMCISLPWSSLECQPPECVTSSVEMYWGGPLFVIITLGFYLLIPSAILTSILVAVLRLRDASAPADAAVRAALGQTRSTAVKQAAKRGLVDAGVWVGGAYVLTGVAHLAILAIVGGNPLSGEASLWLTRLGIAVVVGGSLIAAHVIDALRAPTSPVQQLDPEPTEPAERRVPLRRRALVLLAFVAGASGLLVGLNVAFGEGDQAAPSFAVAVALVGAWVLGLSVAALAWLVLMPLAREAVPRTIGAVSRLAGKFGAHKVGAVLAVRASTRWIASSRVIVVLAGLAFIFGLASTAQSDISSDGYTPFAAGVPAGVPAQDSIAISVCDAECALVLDSLEQEDAIDTIVPAGSAGVAYDNNLTGLTFIDPADLDGIDDQLAARLRDEPSVVLMPPVGGTITIDDFDPLGIDITGIGELPAEYPRGVVNRVWAQEQMGALDSTYFYAYPAEGWTPDEAYDSLIRTRSDDYRWAIEQGDRSDWVDGDSAGGTSNGSGDDSNSSQFSLEALLLWAVIGAIVIIPIAATATAAVVRRRRDDATMAALGASAATLRAAVVIEAVVTAGLALGAGLLGGALTHVAISAGSGAISGLYGLNIDDLAMSSLTSVDWPGLLVIWAFTLAVFALVSWIASRSLRTLSPVEALRPAHEGVLR